MSALVEARESLTYWESRLDRLPRHAVKKRREAREMAARWRERVCEAERRQYGAGILGVLLLVLSERRLPVAVRHTGRTLMKVGMAVTAAIVVLLVAVAVAVGAVAIEVLSAIV
jgi:hypothetical protein